MKLKFVINYDLPGTGHRFQFELLFWNPASNSSFEVFEINDNYMWTKYKATLIGVVRKMSSMKYHRDFLINLQILPLGVVELTQEPT